MNMSYIFIIKYEYEVSVKKSVFKYEQEPFMRFNNVSMRFCMF